MAHSAWGIAFPFDFGSDASRSAHCSMRLKFILNLARPPAGPLYPSGTSVKTDRDIIAINNDRNFASAIRVLEHSVHLVGLVNHADIFDLHSFFAVGFTSRSGIGSCVFTEYENTIRHALPPSPYSWQLKYKIIK